MAWNDFLKTPNGKFWSELLYHHSSQLHRYFDIIAEMEPQSCRSVVRIDHLVRKLTRYAGGLPLGRHAKDWKIIQAKAAKHEGT